ncbi:MAG: permease, partial [Candidatus Baltobacteraceae bacterium]
MNVLHVVLSLLGLLAAGYIYFWGRAIAARGLVWPKPIELLIGFVTNFFDTLGIGSFAPTTSAFKVMKLVPDERIPGTLNVGHALPTVVEALAIILLIGVDPFTLVVLIIAAIAGAWLGAGIVAQWPRRYVQTGMGLALLAAAVLFALKNLHVGPAGGHALALHGTLLWIGIAGNFVLGALMTLGIGLYAPAMIMIGLLGMDLSTAWPIMMGSCAFLMPFASGRFIRFNAYELRAALGLAIGGVPGVLIAAFIVKSLDITV